MADSDQRSGGAQNTENASRRHYLELLKLILEIVALIIGIVGVLIGSVNAFLNWLENPRISVAWVTVALLALVAASGLYWLVNRQGDQRGILWKISQIVFLASSYALVLAIGLILGGRFLPSHLSDHAYFNFEENEQGWKVGTTQKGFELGHSCKSCTDLAFAGRHSLKFQFSLNSEAGPAGIGRLNSPYTVHKGDTILAYLFIPEGSPTNVVANIVLYENSNRADTIKVISEAELKPGEWTPIVWEAIYYPQVQFGLVLAEICPAYRVLRPLRTTTYRASMTCG